MDGVLYRENVCTDVVLPDCVLEAEAVKWKCIDCGPSCPGSLQQISGTDTLASVSTQTLTLLHTAAPFFYNWVYSV